MSTRIADSGIPQTHSTGSANPSTSLVHSASVNTSVTDVTETSETKSQPARMSDDKRLDVQGLRTVAIFAVLLFHFFPEYFPNGFLGVDIFFVISGYLITSILKKRETFGWETFWNFYFRRIKRILPLYLPFVIVAVALFTYNSNPEDMFDNQLSATMALLFSTNLYSMIEQDDYFKGVFTDNLFTHTWSLGVEVQFYVLAPFLFLFRSRLPSTIHSQFFTIIAFSSLILFIFSGTLISFNLVFARLWQFISTSVVDRYDKKRTKEDGFLYEKLGQEEALLGSEKAETQRRVLDTSLCTCALYWASFLSLLLPLMPFTLESTSARIVIITATAIIIQYGDRYKNILLSNEPTVFVGDISYSMYLIHWPLSVYYTRATKVLSYERFSLIPTSLTITIVVYLIFERYYRRWSNMVTKVFIIVFYAIAFACVFISPTLNQRIYDAALADQKPTVADAIRQNQAWFKNPTAYFTLKECNYTTFRNVTQLVGPRGLCEMPKGKGKLKFVVVGNSYVFNHADLIWKHFNPFISEFHSFCQSSCEVLSYTGGDCHHLVDPPDVLDEFKPDVTFIVQRYIGPKKPLPVAGEVDAQLEDMYKHMERLKNMSSLFFIMDSFPAFNYYEFVKMNDMIRNNMTAEEINSAICLRDEDKVARPRTKKLAEKYKDVVRLYDVEPGLTDKEGRFCALDPDTMLSFFEPGAHLTPWGRKKIEYIYANLATQYKNELTQLSAKLYPG